MPAALSPLRHAVRGMLLIEAMIAVLVVSFGVLGLAQLQSSIHANSAVSKARTQAQFLGRQVLDGMAVAQPPESYGNGSDTVPGAFAAYQRTWRVQANPVGDAAATVTVTWEDSRGRSDFIVLSSVLGKYNALGEARLLAARGGLPGGGGYGPNGDTSNPPWTPVTIVNPTPDPTPTPTPTPEPAPTSYRITGSIVITGRADIKAVTVGTTPATPCTLAGSAYSCQVPARFTGTVNVTSTAAQTVTPGSRSYSNVSANISDQNYVVNK